MVDHPTPTNGARCRPLVDTIARHPSPHSFETFDPTSAQARLLATGGMPVPDRGTEDGCIPPESGGLIRMWISGRSCLIGPAAFAGREGAR